MKEVYIVAAKRTPIGRFLGSLSSYSATELGAIAIRAAYTEIELDPSKIDSVYFGNVLSANLGQAPARQASILAGISERTDCTTVNKVCAAGMKATILGAQQIQLGLEELVIAGGMESMSNVPYYTMLRTQTKLGNEIFIDGLLNDGLTDVYSNLHMGAIAEETAIKYHLSRQDQDEYAVQSYEKSKNASLSGKFAREIVPIKIKTKNGETIIDSDEDIHKLITEKVSKLKPTFIKDGTITAANASNLNDGAAALVLASKESVEKYKLKPLAKIIAYADAALAPEEYAIAPSVAIQNSLKRANLSLADIDFLKLMKRMLLLFWQTKKY